MLGVGRRQARLRDGDATPIGDDEVPADAGDVPVGGLAVAVAVGGNHSCALLTTGRARCWGHNSSGQLGYGVPDMIGDDEPAAAAGDVPVF